MNKLLFQGKNKSKTKKEVFKKWKQTDTSDAMSITAHITARIATAAALITSKSEAMKPTPPKQNAPTADLLNTEADLSAERRITYKNFCRKAKAFFIFEIFFLQEEYRIF